MISKKEQTEKYSERYSMDFEFVLRRFIGDKGYGLAGIYFNNKAVKKELLRILPSIKKHIDSIDTSNRHKQLLFSEVISIKETLKTEPVDEYKDLSISVFKLCSLLFGFTNLNGKISHLVYWQNTNSYLFESEEYINGKNIHDVFIDNKKNVITLRKEVFDYLKSKKVDDNTIAQVLNTTEYQVKRIKNYE